MIGLITKNGSPFITQNGKLIIVGFEPVFVDTEDLYDILTEDDIHLIEEWVRNHDKILLLRSTVLLNPEFESSISLKHTYASVIELQKSISSLIETNKLYNSGIEMLVELKSKI